MTWGCDSGEGELSRAGAFRVYRGISFVAKDGKGFWEKIGWTTRTDIQVVSKELKE
jgi:hypothetical protein